MMRIRVVEFFLAFAFLKCSSLVDGLRAGPRRTRPSEIEPSSSPSAEPSREPFIATSIESDKNDYDFGEAIKIQFAFGNDFEAKVDDWIGIYPASANSENLKVSEAFLFLCGTTTRCAFPIEDGEVTFHDNTLTTVLQLFAWPINPGNYKAYLLRGGKSPFEVMAETEVFTINQDFFVNTVVPTVRNAERDIRDIIRQEPTIGPKFVRLGFHDCTGGCDGCVDMQSPDNAGLDIPIDALAPIVDRYENKTMGISRADIWALSALVGTDVAQERSATKVDFSLEYIGRVNCEDRFNICRDDRGRPRECSAKLGPFVALPEPDITTEDLFHFFSREFSFTVEETVALMGAHTLGSLKRENSGFDGPNGWVRDNMLLDNDYYHELVGGAPGASLEQLIDFAPPWFRFEERNGDLPGIPNRPAWKALPPAFDGSGTEEILMLNSDIALVRELNSQNLAPNGRVNCAFIDFFAERFGQPRCPHARQSLQFAANYKFDNALWLRDFELVYKKMLNHGYDYVRGKKCPGDLCVYDGTLD